MKTKPLTKYESLSYLLGQYGSNQMDDTTFWREMNARGYTQDDIDRWCDEYYQIEAQKELDNARRQEEQDRTERARAARYARGTGRQEQEPDRPHIQTKAEAGNGEEARQDYRDLPQGETQWPGSIRITLIRDELVRCWRTAKKRDAIKLAHTDRRVSSRPGYEIHFDGLRTELGIAIHVGKPELVDFSVQLHGDGGTDMMIGGRRAQIKASTYMPPYLRFDPDGSQAFTADIAILVYVPLAPTEPDKNWCDRCGYVDLIGWITREEFMARATERDFGHGRRLVVEPPLHDMALLI